MYNLLKVGLAVPQLHLAEPEKNADEIIALIKQASSESVELLVFPELAITGATCGDLFKSQHLIQQAELALEKIAQATSTLSVSVLVGLPLMHRQVCYNAMAYVHRGFISHYHLKQVDSQQSRWFSSEPIIGSYFLFHHEKNRHLPISHPRTPVRGFMFNGYQVAVVQGAGSGFVPDNAHVLIYPWLKPASAVSATPHLATLPGKAFLSLTPGSYESTTDYVYTGETLIYEDRELIRHGQANFASDVCVTYLDMDRLSVHPDLTGAYPDVQMQLSGTAVLEQLYIDDVVENQVAGGVMLNNPDDCELLDAFISLRNTISPTPYLPVNPQGYDQILHLVSTALVRRLRAAHAKSAVIGISGGLDSTMALVALCHAFEVLDWDKANIIAVTLPGFGTSEQTYGNAQALADALGVKLREISIVPSVTQHLADIGHDGVTPDVTYENAQARERTQILMDMANMYSGIVIGTGDLSEAMLGFSTYNGDHMCMYNPNAGLLKTVIRHTLTHLAKTASPKLADSLSAIVDTPISPELLPANKGAIAQKTEDILGSYLVNDFFIYHHLRGIGPVKLLFLARAAFESQGMSKAQLKEALKHFYGRFFASQFKRSASPDGPDVMGMTASPRGGLVMPSDVTATSWLQAVEAL